MIYIVVPYRKRKSSLREFIRHFQNTGIRILIVEQGDTYRFNRGLMLNIGIDYLRRHDSPDAENDILVLHDLDFLPRSMDVYACDVSSQRVHHLLGYHYTLGGVVAMSFSTFALVNGFPNHMWGWGGEDWSLKYRCEQHACRIITSRRYPVGDSKGFIELPHPRGEFKDTQYNETHIQYAIHETVPQMQQNGLSTLRYEISRTRTITPNITKITVIAPYFS